MLTATRARRLIPKGVETATAVGTGVTSNNADILSEASRLMRTLQQYDPSQPSSADTETPFSFTPSLIDEQPLLPFESQQSLQAAQSHQPLAALNAVDEIVEGIAQFVRVRLSAGK